MSLGSVAELLTIASFFPFISQVLDENFYRNEFFLRYQELFVQYEFNIFEGNKNIIFNFFLIFLLFTIINCLLRIVITKYNLHFIKDLSLILTKNVLKKFLYQKYESLAGKNSSKVFSIFVNKNDSAIFFISNFFNLVNYIAISLFIIISLLYVNFKTTITVLTILITLYIFIIWFIKNNIKEISKRTSEAFSERVLSVQKSLIHIRHMLLSNTQEFYIDNLLESEKKIRKGEADILFFNMFPRIFFEALAIIFIVLLIFISIFYFTLDKNFILSYLAVVALALQRLLICLNSVYVCYINISSTKQQALEIAELLNSELVNADNKINEEFNKEIIFKNVTFKYKNSTSNILQNINLNINKGTIVGLVGKTGSGKTTFLDLFCGLLKPQKGKILYDDNDLYKNLYSWQKKISYAPQITNLFDSSILDNIILDNSNNKKVNLIALNKAINISQLTQIIKKLPNGYNTLIGDGGIRLSGGQSQRIGIAKAIYKNSEILILDEFTSSIDYETENTILTKIISEYKHKTILIVSHRTNTLKYCDKIIEFKNKKIYLFKNFQNYISYLRKKKNFLRN